MSLYIIHFVIAERIIKVLRNYRAYLCQPLGNGTVIDKVSGCFAVFFQGTRFFSIKAAHFA